MKQQINLYQINLQPEPVILTFMHILHLTILLLIIMSCFTCYKFISYYSYQSQLSTLNKQKISLQTELKQAKTKLPPKEEQEKLRRQIKALEIDALQMQKMHSILAQLQLNAASGFVKYLKALAKYNIPEIWLTAFKFTSSGNIVSLSGKTTNAKHIPKLLQQLSNDAAFKGKTFEVLNINVPAKEKIIQFTVGPE